MLPILGVALLVALARADVVEECSGKKLDVYLVVDKSASISGIELDVEKKAVHGIIDSFDIGKDKTRVGLVVFSNDTEHIFSLGDYNTHDEYAKVDVIPRPFRKVGTLTHLGLESVLSSFADEGRDNVQQAIVVITDGKSTGPVPLLATCTKIHTKTDITVVSVGVGRDADFAELDLIASGTDGDNVYLANSYESLNLFRRNISAGVCKGVDDPKDKATCPAACLEFGTVTGGSKAGDTAYFSCDGGYSVNGATSAKCLDSGKWDEDIPKCVKNCESKADIPFGSVEYLNSKENAFGGVVQYTCNSGYVLKGGDEFLGCEKNGKWNSTTPRCQEAVCRTYGRFAKGRVTQDVTVGGKSVFTCNIGYYLDGADTLTCQENGLWDQKPPKCIRKSGCRTPRFFAYGSASKYGYVDVGESVTYKCHPGFTMSGSATLTCKNNKKWDENTPKCKRSACKFIPYIRNGKIARDGYTDSMTVTCENGYELKGESKLTCINRSWDNRVPTCSPTTKCKAIRYFRNGHITDYSREIGSKVTITCNKGWYLSSDDSTLTCKGNGEWSAKMPYCIRDEKVTDVVRTCPQILDLVSGSCSGSTSRFSTIKCSCAPGYILSGKEVIRCQTGARWSIPMMGSNYPRCTYARCKQLGGVLNGLADYKEDNLGARVTFSCIEGFELRGPKIMSCRNGKWDTSKLPKCRPVRCPNMLAVARGEVFNVTSGDNHGATRSIACEEGYEVRGQKDIICFKRKWRPSVPKCKRAPVCMSRDNIKNGKIESTSFKIGAKLTYTCNEGYTLNGPSKVTCQSNGEWSATPKCELTMCPHIPTIANGKLVNYKNLPGRQIEVVCDEGFERIGNRLLVCQQDGTWDADVPTCEGKTRCPTLCLDKGRVEYEGRNQGDFAKFLCNNGFVLDGADKLECIPPGVWDGVVPICESDIPKVCDSKKMDVYFVVDASNPKNRDMLENTIKKIASHFKIAGPAARVGVISFDTTARIEVGLKEFQNESEFLTADLLNQDSYDKGHNMYRALDLLTGSYIYPVTKELVAIIITENQLQRTDLVQVSLNKLDALGVSIFAVGIGNRAKTTSLSLLATGNGTDNVFKYTDFDELYEGTTARKFAKRVCGYEPEEEEEAVLPTKPTEACEDVVMDVYFVVDTSKSISTKELAAAEETVRYIINNFDIGPNKTRIGLITYNRHVFQDFHLDTYDNRDSLNALDAIVTREDDIRGGTRTDLALEQMLENFADESSGRDRVLVLITDGKATAPVKAVARSMDKTNIKRIAIGVGKYCDRDELNLLATGKTGKYVVVVRDFDDLKKLDSMIATAACDDFQ